MLKILEHITHSGKSYKPGDPDVPEGTFGADEARLLGFRKNPTDFDHVKPALALVPDAPKKSEGNAEADAEAAKKKAEADAEAAEALKTATPQKGKNR